MDYRRVRVNGLETAYVDVGDDRKRSALLIHDGSPGSDALSCWGPLIPYLSDFRIVAPDLPGAGKTSKVAFLDADFYAYIVPWVRALCEVLLLERPVLVGASVGGGLVLRSAASRAVPMSCGVSIAGPGGRYMNADGLAPIRNYEPTIEAAMKVEETLVSEPDRRAAEQRLERSRTEGHLESIRMRRLHVLPDAREGEDPYEAMLGRINVPIMLLAGSDDPLVEPGWAEAVADRIATAEHHTLARTRHLPHLEQPEDVARLIERFSNRHA